MKGLLGHRPKGSATLRRADRHVKKLIKEHPDVWPSMVVHGQERWQDMPTDQFDWAMEQIRKRRGSSS